MNDPISGSVVIVLRLIRRKKDYSVSVARQLCVYGVCFAVVHHPIFRHELIAGYLQLLE